MIDIPTIQLDDQRPKHIDNAIKHRERALKKSFPVNHGYLPLNDNYVSDIVGYDPRKLLAWRQLECRLNVLRRRFDEFEKYFVKFKQELLTKARETGAKEAWVAGIESIVYIIYDDNDGHGVCHSIEDMSTFVEECRCRPTYKGYIVSEEDRQEFLRLIERSHTFYARYNTFNRAFKYAIEDRLATYFNDCLSEERVPFKTVVIISNDDRQYYIEVNIVKNSIKFNWSTMFKVFIAS